MSRPRLALLLAAEETEHCRRNFRRELDADIVEFHLPAGQCPTTFEYDGAVVTGSRASVYDDEPWIEPARDWVREAAERELPLLGVCWGHQLVADALGGRVEPMDAYELGYHEIRRCGDAPLFDGLGEAFVSFVTHADEVVELPPGAELLAKTDRSIHAFRAGTAYGVQFHPEYDRETARTVARDKEGLADDGRVERALASVTDERYAAACETKRLFENFLAVVEDAPGGRTDPANDDATAADGEAGAD